jgi:hypothetical protein
MMFSVLLLFVGFAVTDARANDEDVSALLQINVPKKRIDVRKHWSEGHDRVTVHCDEEEEILIGGGCDAMQTPHKMTGSFPNDNKDGWVCVGADTNLKVWAICASGINNVEHVSHSGTEREMVSCPVDHILSSGGCEALDGEMQFSYNSPLNSTTYQCGDNKGTDVRVHALCVHEAEHTIQLVHIIEHSEAVHISCPDGHKVTGGGCNSGYPFYYEKSGPKNSRTWECSGKGGEKVGQALCMLET